MSFIATAATAVGSFALSKSLAGFSAEANKDDVRKAKQSINQNFQQKMNMLFDKRRIDEQNIERTAEKGQVQTNVQTRDVIKNVMKSSQDMMANQGFAIGDSSNINADDIVKKYNNTMRDIFNTREFNKESLSVGIESQIAAIEDEKDKMTAQVDRIPTTFREGALGF